MTRTVTIADYGIGNLLSVARAFEKVGATVEVTRDHTRIAGAELLILPGVGAFGDCMTAFMACGFEDPVRKFAASGRPLLGLCVGMQILFDGSEEFGFTNGLGLIPGQVKAIPKTSPSGKSLKLPHIGWTDIMSPVESLGDHWKNSVLHNIRPSTPMYFVHSFTAWPTNPDHRLADAEYGGNRICATTRKDNILGAQFHPEKSGPDGLLLLANFVGIHHWTG
jgi:imidazole glycerol-phosphate synthase subunit HisH